MSEVLTDEEVAEITGFIRSKQQKEWLIKNNWPFSVKKNGRPSVHRLVMRMKLGVPIENTQTDKEEEFILDLTKVG
ncbi:DUF4224 domain-containing protein [Entomomonas sp. E2T0]|uniref:DUF4224 domain-containing protein n=1 Tax=Entomomonas sp. E2T0 TaxID=2930213 RepID=UPI00222810FE|nr:DUF4224 domain-containing protein [Entomomonas sp. E2T0]UYZ83174.1 DUF4224 domain-containing protein [Entomomonas sp. E2T0]